MRKSLFILFAALLCTLQVWAQRTISGRVLDEAGDPVPGASVLVKGTRVGTVTDANGNYTINVPANGRTITVSGVGFTAYELALAGRTDFNVSLRRGTTSDIEGVVVTGYTTRSKSNFAGATTKVSADKIDQVPVASFENLLQGRAPGLYIASGSGQPGANARVNIRGVGSIQGGNDPLYVLDGVPIEPGVFRTLNPNDFASVDVLKDAVGAGQYGSRGGNGVIVITSKRGRTGRTQISYRGQAGVSQAPGYNDLRLMNTAERLQYEEQILGRFGVISGVTNGSTTPPNPPGTPVLGANNGITGFPGWDYSPINPRYNLIPASQRATEALLLDSIRNINTDWADLFFRNGTFNQHEVTASGGSGNLNFFTSLSMYKQEGVIIRSNLDRYTFRANVDFKTERLRVNVNSTAGYTVSSGIESESAVALANPVAAAYLELPYRRAFDPLTGKTITNAGLTGSNAYDRLFTTTSVTNQFKGNLGITLQYDIWNGIGFRTTNGVDWRINTGSRFINPTSFAGAGVANGQQGSYNESNSENLQLISTTGLTYTKNIGEGRHVINAQAMVEAIRNRNRGFSATGFGINPNLPNTPAGITAGSTTNNFIPTIATSGLNGSRSLNGIFSLFGLADYTYNNKYTISGYLRQDAPSQVPEKNRNNIFAGGGVTWNVIKEDFLANQNVVQEARLRASYGETGNIQGFTSDFGYIPSYGNGSYAGVAAIVPSSPGNLDYKLESQKILNFGTDLSFLNRRLRITADYYIKTSENLFIGQSLSRTTGFVNLNVNAGEMENRGFEFGVNGDVVSKGAVLVTVGVNGAFNKNEVTNLGLLSDIPGGTSIVRVGYPFGSHFQVGYLGVDPSTGFPIYEDINGNPTSIYSAGNNRSEYGTFLPQFTGGATLDATFKNFDISLLFSTAQGVKRFNNESFFYETTTANIQFNKRVEILTETWQKPGDMTNYQNVRSPRQFSSRDVQDASFVRFRNLQAGYTFRPQNKRLFQSFRIWGQGQNLYTWTTWQGFDPEESNNIAQYEFPNPRTFTVGLDVNF